MQELPFMTNSGFETNTGDDYRWDKNIKWYALEPSKWVKIRFFGTCITLYYHWIKTKNNKSLPIMCRNWDYKNNQWYAGSDRTCPICAKWDFNNAQDEAIKRMAARKQGLIHGIIRDLQSKMPQEPREWIRPMQIPATLMATLAKFQGLNIVNYQGKEYPVPVNDYNYGKDVNVYYDAVNQNPQQRYNAQLDALTPLTDNEKEQVKLYIIDFLSIIKERPPEDIERILKQQGYLGGSIPLAQGQGMANTYQLGAQNNPPPAVYQIPPMPQGPGIVQTAPVAPAKPITNPPASPFRPVPSGPLPAGVNYHLPQTFGGGTPVSQQPIPQQPIPQQPIPQQPAGPVPPLPQYSNYVPPMPNMAPAPNNGMPDWIANDSVPPPAFEKLPWED